ncbi:hypothetical protein SKAU_G00118340 [Synaphobranchus kaupii]|uniref:C2H2-type domain-containing protein n=1 Tax=Synaphobranchus kaupii TaxID=118154 RepID=A0A9Q1J251_SYNKA|nr:hypothetical protein SKAU_G00118340 [Synaphobranchus kaupii]
MQAGVCLRQDTETTLPELTEQHRIRQKEEELSGLQSVHMAESETECAAPGLNTLEPECVSAHSGELHFCTPLSSRKMQAGVCLRQDTETTLPELTEQHRIRQKEEELSGLQSVHMAESETECAAPVLNTLEPECVSAHSGELHFCTHLSSSMMQAGVFLRQDTETTLPELTEQHRIRQKEEELSGLESVHMAETECAAPGLNTLEPECVSAHSGELCFCTPLSSSMMQTGVCLRQITETTLPELTEQHRMGQTEEELGGLESVHMAESETECTAPGLDTLERVTAHSGELHFCTPFSSRKIEAGVCLRQETETTRPELTEQHRIRQKEEELSGLESVHMAESETECAAPGLNTLEPECVSAHSGVSDVHHTHTSMIKTETDLDSIQTAGLKTENLYSTELGYETHLHPDQIKTETDDGGYIKPEHSNLQDIKCVNIKYDQMKCECSESLVSDLMSTVMNAAGVDDKSQTESWQCAGEPNANCEKKEIHDMPTQCGKLNHHCDINNENNQTRNFQKITNSRNKHVHCRGMNVILEPVIMNFKKNQGYLNSFENETIHPNKGEIYTWEKPYKCTQCQKLYKRRGHLKDHMRIHTGEKPYKCAHCEKCFSTNSVLIRHLSIHTGEKPYKCTQCEKLYKRRGHLKDHMRIHTDEKPKCTQCEKCFRMNSALMKCLHIHTGEKPYKCTQCDKSYNTRRSLKDHMRIHTDEKPYMCTQCEKCFCTKSVLVRHLRIHTGEKPYKCTQCVKCFNRKSDLKNHLRIHTGEKPYNCTQCEKCFSTNSLLIRHLRIHTVEKPYKCTQCEKLYKTRGHLKDHIRSHTGEKPYKCTQCEKCFCTNSALMKHLNIHTGEKPYKCTQCEKCFCTKSLLVRHLRHHTGEKPYKCTQCVKCFNRKSNLKNHLRIHIGDKPYKCTQCEKCFSTNSLLIRHLRIHTVEKPYKCTQCEKLYKTRGHLKDHMRIHTGGKPYKCTQCEKCFRSNSALMQHLLVHTGEKPYKCTQCEKSYNTRRSLKDHMKIHTDEKPYMCTQCEKCFSRKSVLVRHLRIHTGEKPYKCTQCEKCFCAKSVLVRHLRNHTGEKPYKCTQCVKCFTRKSDLKNHLRIHTGDKPYKCTQCEKCFCTKSVLVRHLRIHTREIPTIVHSVGSVLIKKLLSMHT